MSTRYEQRFAQLARQQEGAFVPFVVVGDPDLTTSRYIIQTLIDAGADALELGLAFSDPLADGPVIQQANTRALQSGATVESSLALIADIRRDNPDIPIGLLMYANLVYAQGLDRFCAMAAHAGVDSMLVADVPLEEFKPLHDTLHRHDVLPVLMLPPDADEATLARVSEISEGYVYLMSRRGVTGVDQTAGMPMHEMLQSLRERQSAPPLLGFGISTPEHVRMAMRSGVAGVICGSAIVAMIAEAGSGQPLQESIVSFVQRMKRATVQTNIL